MRSVKWVPTVGITVVSVDGRPGRKQKEHASMLHVIRPTREHDTSR
jgi:hypothetical protein